MDEAVKTLTAMPLAFLALACSLACPRALAESLVDPTRPPAALGARAEEGTQGSSLPRLQSVLIAPRQGGRQVAVIDGETVRLGGLYKGARVARMTQTEVELVKGRERQVLRLEPLPGMQARAAAGAKQVN